MPSHGHSMMLVAAQASLVCGLVFCFATPWPRQAQEKQTPDPRIAPLDPYLMPDRNAEMALARSAAPDSISQNAEVEVLGRNGYELAVKGTNGFVCLVERGWMGSLASIHGYGNPKIRGAVCFNPPAARSILPILYMRTKWVLAGLSKEQIIEKTKVAYANRELPALELGAMCYMMSKHAYLTDADDHNVAHLMFYTLHGADWGADLPKSPVHLNPQFKDNPEPIDVFMVFTGMWSDGTPAPAM